jgi:hypothetical protein
MVSGVANEQRKKLPKHLRRLESETIEIMREVGTSSPKSRGELIRLDSKPLLPWARGFAVAAHLVDHFSIRIDR